MTDPILTTLGLARKSGALAIGEAPVEEACKARKAKLVLLSAGAAGNTADRAKRLARECGAPLAALPFDKSQVGFALGRSVCAVLALKDAGFAALIQGKSYEEKKRRKTARKN